MQDPFKAFDDSQWDVQVCACVCLEQQEQWESTGKGVTGLTA